MPLTTSVLHRRKYVVCFIYIYIFFFFEGTVALRDGTYLSIKPKTCWLFKILFQSCFFFSPKKLTCWHKTFLCIFLLFIIHISTSNIRENVIRCQRSSNHGAASGSARIEIWTEMARFSEVRRFYFKTDTLLSVSTFTFAVIGEL